MKRYTVRLANTLSSEQLIQEQIEILNQFITARGLTTMNGLKEEFSARIESVYNAMLAALGDLYQNFTGKNSNAYPIYQNLETLKQAFINFKNDPLCRNYTPESTYAEIATKINDLETKVATFFPSSVSHSI